MQLATFLLGNIKMKIKFRDFTKVVCSFLMENLKLWFLINFYTYDLNYLDYTYYFAFLM